MTHNAELEAKVVQKFFKKQRRDRYVNFVSSEKNRHKLVVSLHAFATLFVEELFDEVKGDEARLIVQALLRNGVSDKICYVISENSEIDAKTLDVEQAISAVVGRNLASILVFGDAEMIYFEGEMAERFMSRKVV